MANWRAAWRYPERIPEVARCLAHARDPLRLIRAYLRFGSWTPMRFELREGAHVDLERYEDLVTAWIIFFRHEYRLPQDMRTMLDLGANIGLVTLKAATEFPRARIVAVEPIPATVARLRRTIDDNGIGARVTPWNIGVAARTEKRVIPAGDWASQCVGMLPSGRPAAPQDIVIDCRSLGDVVSAAQAHWGSAQIDFVKMDIEGAEHESLHAAPRDALAPVRAIGMEYHMNADKKALFDVIRSHGFVLRHDRPFNYGTGIAHFERKP